MPYKPAVFFDRPVKKNIFVNLNNYAIPNTVLFNFRVTGSLETIEKPSAMSRLKSIFTPTLLAINKHEILFYARHYKISIFKYLSSGRVFALPVTVDLSLRDIAEVMHLVMQKNPSDIVGFLGSSYFFDGLEYRSMDQTCSSFLQTFRFFLHDSFAFKPFFSLHNPQKTIFFYLCVGSKNLQRDIV
jgi:hypothetical protein